MVVALVESGAIREFVDDSKAFDAAVDAWFVAADVDRDGVLSQSELRKWLEHQEVMGISSEEAEDADMMYREVFEMFDSDKNGVIDRDEFKTQVRMMLLSMADGLGGMAVSMDIGDKSLVGAVLAHKKPYFFTPLPSRPGKSVQSSQHHTNTARPPIPRPPKTSRPPKASTMITSVS